MRKALAFAFCAVLGWPMAARADGDIAWVRGEGADACPSSERLKSMVAARLGRSALSLGTRELSGFVLREGDGTFSARMFLRDESGALVGSKKLTSDGEDCEALGQAVALAMALAIDPDAVNRTGAGSNAAPTREPAPRPEASVASPTPPVLPPTSPVRDSRVARDASGTRETPEAARAISASARAMLTLGLTPHVAAGFGAVLHYPRNRLWQATFGFLWAPEASLKREEFGVGLTAGRAGACLRPWAEGPFAVRGCATLLLGALHASGHQDEVSPSGDRFWSATALEGGMTLMVHPPFLVELTAEMVVPFRRETFLARTPPRNGFEQPVVTGVFGLGAGVAIP